MKQMRVSDHTLICLRWHQGFCDTQTSILSGQRKARPALLLISPWGFLTQNKQKVCFLGLQKSSRHLVLYRGQIINHSALSLILYFPTSFATFCIYCAVSLWSFLLLVAGQDTLHKFLTNDSFKQVSITHHFLLLFVLKLNFQEKTEVSLELLLKIYMISSLCYDRAVTIFDVKKALSYIFFVLKKCNKKGEMLTWEKVKNCWLKAGLHLLVTELCK